MHGGHPFYVAEVNKFIAARELEVGTKLLLSTGACAIIEAIQTEQLTTPETTYNFEVADFHTYYVGENCVLVHNTCGFGKYTDGMEMSVDDALDAATDFLGDGYKELSSGRFVSRNGIRQVRMKPSDLALVNNHAGRPHLNFDLLKPKYKSIHIFLKGK